MRLEDKVGRMVKGLHHRSQELRLLPGGSREMTEEAPKVSTSEQSTGF